MGLPLYAVSLPRHPFFRRYGVILPSSLRRVLSRALARFVPGHLCRFAVRALRTLVTRLFLSVWAEPLRLCLRSGSCSRLGRNGDPDLPRSPAYTLNPGRPTPGRPTLLRPPVTRNGYEAGPECQPAVHRLRLSASP